VDEILNFDAAMSRLRNAARSIFVNAEVVRAAVKVPESSAQRIQEQLQAARLNIEAANERLAEVLAIYDINSLPV
jgi:hypothetical protein